MNILFVTTLSKDKESLSEEEKKEIVKQKLNYCDQKGWNLLGEACEKGSLEVIELFLSYGVDINQEIGEFKQTPLIISIAKKQPIEVIKLLIEEHKADVNKADIEGLTALHIAAMSGEQAICKLLVENDANACAQTKEFSIPTICERQGCGTCEGCKKSAKSVTEVTPVGIAQLYGKKETALYLQGYNTELLFSKVKEGSVDSVKELLYGASVKVNRSDEKGHTALYHACKKLKEINQQLKNASDNSKKDQLKKEEKDYLNIVKLLIKKGATAETEGQALLFSKVKEGAIDNVVLYGALVNVDHRDDEGHTALYHACKKLKEINQQLKNASDSSEKDKLKKEKKDYMNIAQLLIEKGAKTKTALQILPKGKSRDALGRVLN